MITQHESFPAPKDRDVSIWRYMDFAKFVWMLQKRALYFCRCDLLGDPYEGYYTKALAEGEDEFVRNMLAATKEIKPETEAAFRSAFKSMLTFTKSMRQELFVSCWHMTKLSRRQCGNCTRVMATPFVFDPRSRRLRIYWTRGVFWVKSDTSITPGASLVWETC